VLITWIDVAFVLGGVVAVAYALWRRPRVPPPAPPPPATGGELLLTGLASIPAAVGPNVLVVALTPGMPGMPSLVRYALLPSVVLLLAVWFAAHRARYTRLANRIAVGVWAGFVGTAALDVLRLTSFSLGLLPGNLPRMFGVLILDRMALGPSTSSDLVGSVYHFWVSACFGLTCFDQIVDETVLRAIDALPDELRETLVLSDMEGFAYQEIGEITEVPIGTVKSRLFRARRILQRQLYQYAVERGYLEGKGKDPPTPPISPATTEPVRVRAAAEGASAAQPRGRLGRLG
jgi:hypothetical protein